MTFYETLQQTIDLLRRHGRVSCRALRRQFALDDETLADLKAELVEVLGVAREEPGQTLVWTGQPVSPSAPVPLEAAVLPPPAPRPATAAADGERRFLTVMFIDLVDSTPLSQRFDPEQLAEVYRAWQDAGQQVIVAFGGHIAEYRGDGVFVYYSYPAAQEDAPQRALRTAFGILDSLRTLNVDLQASHDVTLAVRIGIHTGIVLLSNLGQLGRERFALGETPSLASRVQALAGAGEVLVSDSTHMLARAEFDFADLGEHQLKGIARPVRVFRALGPRAATARPDAGACTPLVGREPELALLRDRWSLAAEGHGRAVMVGGEPGIGKSRLVAAHRHHAESLGAQRVTLRCSPYHTASMLHPVIGHLERLLGFGPGMPDAERLQRLQASLAQAGMDAASMPLFAGLLSVPLPPELQEQAPLPPRALRERTITALVRWLIASAQRRPMLLLCEDLHWADPTTLEMVGELIEEMAASRLMAVMTFRTDFEPPWPQRSHVSHVTLTRLSDAEAWRFAGSALRGRSLSAPDLAQIVERADGVPMFIEELIAAVADRMPGSASPPPIPDTLQGSLMMRLDRLADAREIAQIGAAAGREFSYALLRAAAECDEDTLQAALSRLVGDDLLQRRGMPPDAIYRFRHALVRDAAYDSTLRTRRVQYHRRIAQALERQFPEQAQAQPELVAHHYAEAGDRERAVALLREAGERALNRCANEEALTHLGRARELLAQLPLTPQRAAQAMHLEVARGAALMMLRGQAAVEVQEAYAAAQAFGAQAGASEELFPVLMGLWRFQLARGDMLAAREVAEGLLRMAQRLENPGTLLGARMALGLTLLHLWDMPRGRELVLAGAEQCRAVPPDQRDIEIFSLGQHPGVACMMSMAFIAWLEGDAAASRRWQEEATEVARRLATPFQLTSALGWSALISRHRGEDAAFRHHLEAAGTLAGKHKLPLWEGVARVYRGLAMVGDGEHAEGLATLSAGIATLEELRHDLVRVRVQVALAEACALANRPQDGLQAIATAMGHVRDGAESWWEPELHRLRGELLLQQGAPVDDAVAAFEQARQLAARRGLRTFELRAGVSLARVR